MQTEREEEESDSAGEGEEVPREVEEDSREEEDKVAFSHQPEEAEGGHGSPEEQGEKG